MKQLFINKTVLVVALITLAVISRWLPHPPNVAPVTAIALLAAVYLDTRIFWLLPLVALLISDLVLGFYGTTMFFVYGSFLMSSAIGWWVRQNPSVLRIASGTLLASGVFFLVSNFGVWMMGTMYTKDLSGLIECYIAGIPFFRNTLVGDLFYTTVLFSAAATTQQLAGNPAIVDLRNKWKLNDWVRAS